LFVCSSANCLSALLPILCLLCCQLFVTLLPEKLPTCCLRPLLPKDSLSEI
jgi:hypothetical protein